VPIQGGAENSRGKRRAVLLLSLILLVWNVFASAGRVASILIPPVTDSAEGVPVPPDPPGTDANPRSVESPRSGPLTIRQKYLLGKRVDINRASLEELSELPGISDEVAAALLEARDRLGGFRSPDDLLGVKGIKAKRLKKILPFLSKMQNN